MDLSTGLKSPRLSCPLGLPHHKASAAAASLPCLALGLGGGLAAPPLAPVRALVSGSSSSPKPSPGAGIWSGEALIIDTVRDSLERQEDSIIVSLLERAQYGYNHEAYFGTCFPITGFSGSLVEYLVIEKETALAKIGKYKSLDETPFYPRLLMEPVVPPCQYPRILHPAAASININEEVWKVYFNELLPKLVKEEDDGKCVSSAECDVAVLKALSKRIHYGKFVAEAKYQKSPDKYEPAIREQDKDKLMEMLTYPEVEKMVTDRVKTKAMMYGQKVDHDNPLKMSDTLAPKINPELASELYDKWVMPLTKEVQVEYLLRRLD